MAGLPLPSIQTVTAKVRLSQSSVLENIFLEDTRVSPGPVSDTIDQFHLITGRPSSSCESEIIILRNSGHGRVSKRILKNEYLLENS